MKRVPRSKLASAAMGLVEVKGRGTQSAQPKLLSPVGMHPCLYYQYRILERRQSGRSSEWVEVHKEDSSEIPFEIEDETGSVWIYPVGSELHSSHKAVLHGGQYTVTTRNALERLGRMAWASGSDRYRLEEEYLAPGDTIYALGTLYQTQDYLREEYADLIRSKIVELKSNPELMKKVDKDRDGKISDTEWDWARNRLQTLVSEHFKNFRGTKVLAADRKAPFIVSNLAETSLISVFGFLSIVKVVTGLVLTLGALIYLAKLIP